MSSMNNPSNWYEDIAKQIHHLKDTTSEKDYKKYKLNLLLCLAQRVTEFSPECGQCQIFQQDISTLTQDVDNLIQADDKDRRKAYLKTIKTIVVHLQKQHKLVTEGQYLGIGMSIGTGIGVALGAVGDNVGSGIPIGVGIGVAIGAALDAKAKKEGRVICPSEKTIASPRATKVLIAIGLGILALGGLVAFFLFRRFA
ncbi:glycine zipper family protein [Chloroflexota bacterium]